MASHPTKIRLLINLPPASHTVAWLKPHWDRLEQFAEIRRTSHNTPEEILPDLRWAEAVIMWAWPTIDEAMMATCPNLKLIGAINGAPGTVHACLNRGVSISETRHCWSPAVAEMALTLILNGLRKVSDLHAAMRAGTEKWDKDFPADFDPLERQLTGRTVGLVGFGGVGRRLAELLQPFQVKLLICDPYASPAILAKSGAESVAVEKLVGSAEIVVLCAAVTPETEGMVNARLVDSFRKNSVLVNVGRSVLIDMKALEQRLKRNDMIAMLDVFDQEPLPIDSILRRLPNAYLTPHRSGGLTESVGRAITWLTDDLESSLNGKPLKFHVTKEMLPVFPLGHVSKSPN